MFLALDLDGVENNMSAWKIRNLKQSPSTEKYFPIQILLAKVSYNNCAVFLPVIVSKFKSDYLTNSIVYGARRFNTAFTVTF